MIGARLPIRFDTFQIISFDCYGTLIDWESGILETLRPYLQERGVKCSDERILEDYSRLERQAQAGLYAPYRHILGRVMRGFAQQHGLDLDPDDRSLLADSLPNWRPFPDTQAALRRLKERYRLAVVSNIDDDLFDETRMNLGVELDWVITAEQVTSYKPSLRNFEAAERTMGVSRAHWLHAAQSLYHDIVPARQFGLATVWVNRRRGLPGFGATPPAAALPDLETGDLRELAERACGE
ncbi:MAG TPA: haloacid dehalogenase type II [bacterium]|nr:haloacid dehalogenase type II [bacterium]